MRFVKVAGPGGIIISFSPDFYTRPGGGGGGGEDCRDTGRRGTREARVATLRSLISHRQAPELFGLYLTG